MRTPNLFLTVVAAIGLAAPARAATLAPEVTATLEPAEIRLDEAADLTITVSARKRLEAVTLPQVDGLDVESVGQDSTYQLVDGVVRRVTTLHLRVSAQHAGTYALPAVEAHAGGQVGTSAPLTLVVTPGGSPRAPAAAAPADDAAPAANGRAFLTVTPTRDEIYVGERIPVEIRACFRAGQRAAIRSLPRLAGSAFALEVSGDEPLQSDVRINGEPYVALSWEGALTAVKEGEWPVEGELDATLVLPAERRRPRLPRPDSLFGGDPFADDFFADAFDSFFAQGREQEVTLRGEPRTVRVKALPAEGRPADFAGAVGRFRIDASATPTTVAAGEPLTLTTTLTGEGNFARVQAPAFPETAGWKSYPAKGEFAPADASGGEGRKTFTRPLIPRGGDVTEIPPVRFSYFDPERAEYVTLETQPIPVTVTGAPTPAGDAPEAAAPAAPSLQRATGPGTRSLRPLWERTGFRIAVLAAAAALAAGLGIARWRRRGARPLSRRGLGAKTDLAIAQSDAPAFFAACRAAVQERLGPVWGVAPGSITAAELRRRGAAADLGALFEAADAVAYSGRAASQEEMRGWQRRVLARLEEVR